MALFGLFGKKKEKIEVSKEMPKPPTPPSTLKTGEMDKSVQPPQHVDDLGFGLSPQIQVIRDEKDQMMGLELPELEFPKLEIPDFEEKEIKKAVQEQSRPYFRVENFSEGMTTAKKIPEELPELEAAAKIPKPREAKPELITIEEPIELRLTPKSKGPVFIRSDQFKAIKSDLISLGETLAKSEETLNNLSELKIREDSEYETWHGAAEAIQRKLLYTDRMLFE